MWKKRKIQEDLRERESERERLGEIGGQRQLRQQRGDKTRQKPSALHH